MIKIVEQDTGQINVDWINRDIAREEFSSPVKPAPARAKTNGEMKEAHDVSDEARDEHGEWTTSGGSGTISMSEARTWLADSKNKAITYHVTSDEGARSLLKGGVTKMGMGALGPGFYTSSKSGSESLGHGSTRELEVAIRLERPLVGSSEKIQRYYYKMLATSQRDPNGSPEKLRQAMLKDYDGFIVRNVSWANGADWVIALKPNAVKFVDSSKESHDVSGEDRDDHGRWSAGGGGGEEPSTVRLVSAGWVVPGSQHPVNLKPETRAAVLKQLLVDAGTHVVTAEDYMHLAGKYLMAEQDVNSRTPNTPADQWGEHATKFYELEETMGDYETADAWLMNIELRAGTNPDDLSMTNHGPNELDECFRVFGSSFEDDKILFRGAIMAEVPQAGDTYHDEAYVSTINTPDDAVDASSKGYANVVSEQAAPVDGASTIWEITIPKGATCLAVRPDEYKSPANDSFQEVLLPRGADFRVESVEVKNKVALIKATYLGSNPRPFGKKSAPSELPLAPPGRAWRVLWLPGDLTLETPAREKDFTIDDTKGGTGSGRRAGHGFGGNQWVKVGGEGGDGVTPKTPKAPKVKGPKGPLTYEKMSPGQRQAVHSIVQDLAQAVKWGWNSSEWNQEPGSRPPSHPLYPESRNSVVGAVVSLEATGIDHEQLVRALAMDAGLTKGLHAGSGVVTDYTIHNFSRDITSLQTIDPNAPRSTAEGDPNRVKSQIAPERALAMADEVMRPIKLAQFAATQRDSQGAHLAAGLADPTKFPAYARESLTRVAELAKRDGMLFPESVRAEYGKHESDLTATTRVLTEHMAAMQAVGRDVQEEIGRRTAIGHAPDPLLLERLNRDAAIARAAMSVAQADYSQRASQTFSIRNDTSWMTLDKSSEAYQKMNQQYEETNAQLRELRAVYDDLSRVSAKAEAALMEVARLDRLADGRVAIQVLSEIRPFGSKLEVGTVGRGAKTAIASFERATAYYPTEWYQRAFGRTIGISRTQKMNIGVSARPTGSAEEVLTYRSGGQELKDSTSVHETGHFMEDVGGRSIEMAEWKFMLDRTTTDGVRDNTKSLDSWQRELTGTRWSRASDRSAQAYKDQFASIYMGKLYTGGTPRSNFELLTMGMENLRNPSRNSPTTDAQYKAFILGMLATL